MIISPTPRSGPRWPSARSAALAAGISLGIAAGCASSEPVPPPPRESIFELPTPTAPVVVEGNILVGGADGVLRSFNLAAGRTTELAHLGASVDELVSVDGGVVAITGDGHAVTKVALDGTLTVLSNNRVDARSLVADDAWAYFIDEASKLRRVPLSGGTTERLNGDDAEKTHLVLVGAALYYRAVEFDGATPVITIRTLGKTGGRPDDLDELSEAQPNSLFSSTGTGGLVLGTQKGAIWGDTDDDADTFEGVAPPLGGAWPVDPARFVLAAGHTLSVVNADRERKVIGKYSEIGGVVVIGRDVFYTDRALGTLSVIKGVL